MDSKRYNQLNNELTIMESWIYRTPEKQTELGLDAAQLQQFNQYKDQFAADMTAYIDPEQRTKAITSKIQTDYKTIHSWIGHLRTGIKNSRKDTLTDQDYASLFIHRDKTTRTRHTEIDAIPTIEIKSHEGILIKLGVSVAGTETPTKPAFPKFIQTLQLNWTYTDNQIPPTDITQHSQNYGTASPILTLDKTQAGKYCHLNATYILPNGTTSQPSLTLTFIVSTV